MQYQTGAYPAAAVSLTRALELYRGLSNRLGEANALNQLGVVQYLYRRLSGGRREPDPGAGAVSRPRQPAWGSQRPQQPGCRPARPPGTIRRATSHEWALGLHRGLSNRLGEANALSNLGIVQQATGGHPAAAANLTRALELYRDLGDRLGEAEALNSLGKLSLASAAPAKARARYEQALVIAAEITLTA